MFVSNGALVATKTPILLTDGASWFPYMPGMSAHGWPSAYSGIYSRQLWVYVVVSKLAKATARLPLPVYGRDDLNRPKRDDHPMAQLLRRPNPGLSGFDLMLWTSSTQDIYGDTFWLKRRENGAVIGLYPLHPSSMTYRDGFWHFDNGSKRMDNIPSDDLVHFRSFHPDSNTRGLSPLEPLRATLENEWNARAATDSFWKAGARPGMFLTHPKNLSDPALRRLREQVDGVNAGSGSTGRTMILEEGMEAKTATLTSEEAQYIETRKLNREEVCAAYDVPPPVVHILDHATFSNITEQMRSMYRDTMAPRLAGIEATIELDLRQAEWPADDVYAEFLLDGVLRGDFEARQTALATASHMTIAEKRKVENLPFVEGTDRIFLNTATLPLDAIDANSAAVSTNVDSIARTIQQLYLGVGSVITAEEARIIANDAGADLDPAAIPSSAARSIMGRLSWQKTLDEVDAVTVAAGFDGAAVALTDALAAEVASGGDVASLRERIRSMSKEQG